MSTDKTAAKTNQTSDDVRILVPLDGSEQAKSALAYAVALAAPHGTIVLLTVVPSADELQIEQGGEPLPAALNIAATELGAAGHPVKIEVRAGDPAQQIVAAAADGRATMIVIGSHGRGGLDRLIHGSVADKVAREATVPVMVVRAPQSQPGPVGIARLVLPLDGSPLAEASLPVATAIARRLGTPLYLVQAVNIAEFMPPAVGMGEAIPFEAYDETETELNKEACSYLDGMATKLREQGFAVATKVLSGPPAAAIGEATKPGDVIVLCSHERSGVVRWLMGSVAEELVRGDNVPVILVPASEAAAAA
jgi:nucleotide-binding universal stress UspA family protein